MSINEYTYYIFVFILGEPKSSQYGLNLRGYTCATKIKTKRSSGASLSKSLKIISVQIICCKSHI